MAEKKTSESVAPAGGGSGMSMLRLVANWTIASVSLAVIAGFVYWAVAIGTRDPHDVPIIRAMEGPSRVQPDEPGGRKASHQGLAVNAVQSDGTVEEPPREVVLAPAPRQLTEEDRALGAASLTEATDSDATVTEVAAIEPEEISETTSEADLDALEIADSVAEALAEREASQTDPDMTPRSGIQGTEYSPRRSLRPKGRPGELRTQVSRVEHTVAVAAAVEGTVSQGTDKPVPIGTRLIQLGAYDSVELARGEWDKLLDKHGDLLEDKSRLVIEAESGGRKFYRLRAVGFASLDDSRSLCSALLARGTPCIPVTAR